MTLLPAALALALLAAAAGASPAEAPPLTPGDVVLTMDDGPRRDAPVAPAHVAATCRVQPTGRLGDCKIRLEQPAGAGLGAWLIDQFSLARISPTARDGTPTAGRLYAFDLEVREHDPAPATAAPKS